MRVSGDIINPVIQSTKLLSSQNVHVYIRINYLVLQIACEVSTVRITDMIKDQCRRPKTSGPTVGIQAGYPMASQMLLAA